MDSEKDSFATKKARFTHSLNSPGAHPRGGKRKRIAGHGERVACGGGVEIEFKDHGRVASRIEVHRDGLRGSRERDAGTSELRLSHLSQACRKNDRKQGTSGSHYA
jgi:hypothetical protein